MSINRFIHHKNIIRKCPVHYGAAFMFESISYITLFVSSEREDNRKGHEVANIGRIQKNKRWTAASWSLCVVIEREVTKSGWLYCAILENKLDGPHYTYTYIHIYIYTYIIRFTIDRADQCSRELLFFDFA